MNSEQDVIFTLVTLLHPSILSSTHPSFPPPIHPSIPPSMTHPVSRSDQWFLFGSQFVQQVVGHLHTSGPKFTYKHSQRIIINTYNARSKQEQRMWNTRVGVQDLDSTINKPIVRFSCPMKREPDHMQEVTDCSLQIGLVWRRSHRFYNVLQTKSTSSWWFERVEWTQRNCTQNSSTAHQRDSSVQIHRQDTVWGLHNNRR